MGGEGGHLEGKAVLDVLRARLGEGFQSRGNKRNAKKRDGFVKVRDEFGKHSKSLTTLQ